MNRNKISKSILFSPSIMSKEHKKFFVSSLDFDATLAHLKAKNVKFTPYRFCSCFCVETSNDDIKNLSDENSVSFISSCLSVKTEKQERDFIHLDNLTNKIYLGQNQTICFIDTGIYPHLDFLFPKNRIVKFVDLINQKEFPYDDNGHGTFVAGIACGAGIYDKRNIGFAPNANIVAIKALSNDGTSDSNVILDAMQWVFEHHRAFNIKVVCMSFGADIIDSIDPLSKGAEALWKRGITIVSASGNSGPNSNTVKSPGCCPYIITVGGVDSAQIKVAEFSSRGPTIYGHKPDLLAPAVNVTSCNNHFFPYTNMSGTSVATPIVAGICADILSKNKNMTNNEIKEFLKSNCTPISGDIDIEGAGYLSFLT